MVGGAIIASRNFFDILCNLRFACYFAFVVVPFIARKGARGDSFSFMENAVNCCFNIVIKDISSWSGVMIDIDNSTEEIFIQMCALST